MTRRATALLMLTGACPGSRPVHSGIWVESQGHVCAFHWELGAPDSLMGDFNGAQALNVEDIVQEITDWGNVLGWGGNVLRVNWVDASGMPSAWLTQQLGSKPVRAGTPSRARHTNGWYAREGHLYGR